MNNQKFNFIKKNQNFQLDKTHDVIKLGIKKEIAKKVSQFYSIAPFPNYNDFDSIDALEINILNNRFLKAFKKYIGLNKKIIEVGSGTCQLSIALAYATNNEIVAFDPTLESLKLGASFAKKNQVNNVKFVNDDIFNDQIREKYFDVVWCSGVLHHTENPKKGFKIIKKWAKKNGLVIIGLYNFYGRFWTVLRQLLFKALLKTNFAKSIIFILDPYLRKDISKQKKLAWFRDQYEHPVETLHTVDEVLEWFDEEGVEFMGSIPQCDVEDINIDISKFNKNRSDVSNRISNQINMLFNSFGQEGGLFLMIGRVK